MSNKYEQQHQQQQSRSIAFLPMLCSSSITKQVKFSHRRCASSSSPSSSSIGEEPSSPKVGCMGQVKRNNKVVEFPSFISNNIKYDAQNSHNNFDKTSNTFIKYHKLKRFFSSKNLTTSPTPTIISAPRTVLSRPQNRFKGGLGSDYVQVGVKCRFRADENNYSEGKKSENVGCEVNLMELDPPLPVVKKTVKEKQGNDVENHVSTLWKRRSGGVPLKSLQVQLSHYSHSLLPENTV